MKRTLIVLASWLLISSLYAANTESTLRHPLITAPLLNHAPKVDGVVDKAEWLGAASQTPFINWLTGETADEPLHYWVGYTADAIHVAFRFDRPPYAVTPSPQQDRVEVLLQPGGQGSYFFFNLYPNGEGQSARRPTPSAASGSWTGAARLTETGWEGELTVPFGTLELKEPARLGDTWHILVFSNRKTPTGEQAMSSFLRTWPATEDWGRLRFGDTNTPVVRPVVAGAITPSDAGALLEVIGGASARNLKVTASLYRPLGAIKGTVSTLEGGDIIVPKDVDLNFFQVLDSQPLEKALANYKAEKAWAESLSVSVAENKRLSLLAPSGPGKYVFHYEVADAGSGEVLAAAAFPFVQRPAFHVLIEPYLLTAKALMITADYRRMTAVPSNAVVIVEMDSERISAPAQIGRTVLTLPCRDRFGQTVKVHTRLMDVAGKVVAEESRPVELPQKPAWFGSTVGVTEDPLPPWSPIELSGDTAKVVLREIRFGKSGLPSAITARGQPLLVAPVSLTLAGKELNWKRKLDQQKPGKVTWTSQAKSGGLSFTMKTTLEYDGMLRYDLTLDPAGTPTTLKNLAVAIPYRSEGVDSREIITSKEFKPYVNLGGMDRGIQWFAEWCKGWQIGELPWCEMTNRNDRVDWQIRFIGKEGKTIREPLTITFGLMPLPARELDLNYINVDRRRTHPGFAVGWSREEVASSLTYPSRNNLLPHEGAMAFRASWYYSARLLQIGHGTDSINLYYVNGPLNGRKLELWLTQGDMELRPAVKGDAPTAKYDRLAVLSDLVVHSDAWQPVGLTWKRNGDQVDLEMMTVVPPANVRSVTATVPRTVWEKALAAESFAFAGQGTLALDEVMILKKALPVGTLAELFRRRPNSRDEFTLIDSMEQRRFYQGKWITSPHKITAGRGGVAGGKYSGLFVEQVDGPVGKALLLPTEEKSSAQVSKAIGLRIGMPVHEQFTSLAGYYSIEHMPDPVLRATVYRPSQEQGLGIEMYGGFSMNGQADAGVIGYAEELGLPGEVAGAGVSACFATPAVDYYVDAWKRNIDYYQCESAMYDNTVNCRVQCKNVAHGCGWTDEKGELHGRWPIFGARELSKRFRWLWHVYLPQQTGKQGVYSLHAGARGFYAVSDFCDVIEFGEGWGMTGNFRVRLPEEWWTEGWQWRLGVPGQLLAGKDNNSFNWVMLYGLLYAQPYRVAANYSSPTWWYIDPANPTAKGTGPFNPYYAKEGIVHVAAPLVLWWQLQDDFNTHTAAFLPFWRNGDRVKLNHPKLRSSFYLHKGKDALVVVSNFEPQEVNAEVTLDFAKLGLDGKKLRVFDAWLDDDYPVEGNTIKLTIPGWQYRLIRIEGQ